MSNELTAVRRLTAILLFLSFALPFALPLVALGQDADAGLPACCRRNGTHHCMMNMGERATMAAAQDKAPRWQAPFERCPYCPASVAQLHPELLAAPPAQSTHAGFLSHPALHGQAEANRRVARDRSRQMRGPPQLSLL